MIHDEFPAGVRSLEAVLDPLLQRGVVGVNVDIGIQAQEKGVAVVVGVVCLFGVALPGGGAEMGDGFVRANQRRFMRGVRAVSRQVKTGEIAAGIGFGLEIGDRAAAVGDILGVDIVVGYDRVIRNRANQRRADAGCAISAL